MTLKKLRKKRTRSTFIDFTVRVLHKDVPMPVTKLFCHVRNPRCVAVRNIYIKCTNKWNERKDWFLGICIDNVKLKKFSPPKNFLQIIRIRRFFIPVTYHCAWFQFSRVVGFTVITELKITCGAYGADGADDNCLHVIKLGLTNGIQCRWCDSS